MEEFKKELHEVAKSIHDIEEAQKSAELLYHTDLVKVKDEVHACQIQDTQHNERMKAFEAASLRQNGTLDKVNDAVEAIERDISKVFSKIGDVHISITSKIEEMERDVIKLDGARENEIVKLSSARDVQIAEIERTRIADDATIDSRCAKEIAVLRVDFLKELSKLRTDFIDTQDRAQKEKESDQKVFLWKIIGGLSAVAFLLFVVIITIFTHTFGGLP